METTIRKRPRVLAILCVTGFIISAVQILLISYPGIRDIAKWYPMLYGMIVALRFISLVGIWHMKKWGMELFIYVLLAKIIVQLLMSDLSQVAKLDIFVSAVFALVFFLFYKRMDRNL